MSWNGTSFRFHVCARWLFNCYVVVDGGSGRRQLRIRCVVRPEREQAILLPRLGLTLPERLSTPKTIE